MSEDIDPNLYSDSQWTRALKKRDAEIERLRGVIENQNKAIDKHLTEIERLRDKVTLLGIRIQARDTLFTELADDLEKAWATGAVNTGTPGLIRRARNIKADAPS